MSDEKKEKKDNGGLEFAARKAIEIAKAVAAEVRKLKEQLVNEGVISDPAATMTGAEAYRMKGKSAFSRIGVLLGVVVLAAIVTVALAESVTWTPFSSTYGTFSIVGDSSTQQSTLTADVINAGTTNLSTASSLTVTATTTATAIIIGADAADAANTQLDTTGAGTITIGSADVTGITLTHDGGSLDVATASTLTLTALTTATATFIGADAESPANTALDTTGAGAITIGSADVTAVTVTTDGTGTAEVVLPAGCVDSTEILDATILNADVNAAAAIALTKLATAGLGDAVAAGSVSTMTEVQGDLVFTTVTLGTVVLTPTDGTEEGEGLKIFDPDAGAFTILSAVMNGTVVSSAGIGGNYAVAVGTVTGATGDDATLTSTEADVIPSTAITVGSAAITTNSFDAVLAAPIVMDGTATTKDFFMNLGIADASIEASPAATVTFTGTLILVTTKAVDNQ